jgi:hypothetical protein
MVSVYFVFKQGVEHQNDDKTSYRSHYGSYQLFVVTLKAFRVV